MDTMCKSTFILFQMGQKRWGHVQALIVLTYGPSPIIIERILAADAVE